MSDANKVSRPVNIGILTVSDTRTEANDTSGDKIVGLATGAGHVIVEKKIVPDSLAELGEQFGAWIDDDRFEVIIATGGTGVTKRDITPEALEPHISKVIPGFGELFRWLSYEDIGTSTIQSRALGALCSSTYVFLLPGSTGAVTLGMEKILLPQLDVNNKPCNLVSLMPRL